MTPRAEQISKATENSKARKPGTSGFIWFETVLSLFVSVIVVAGVWIAMDRVRASHGSIRAAAAARPAFEAYVMVQGPSMLPTFAESEIIKVEFCKFSDLRASDTVIAWDDRMKIFKHHRLSHRDHITNRWITQGDNSKFPDAGFMTSDEFVGRTHRIAAKAARLNN